MTPDTANRAFEERIAEAQHALRAYREAKDDGRLTREEAIYLMGYAFFQLLLFRYRPIWLRDFEPRDRAIRDAYGLGDGEEWEPDDRPEEYRRYLDDHHAAMRVLEDETAREHGCEELLHLHRHDRAELDRLYDEGRRSWEGPQWELRTRYRPARDPAEWVPETLRELAGVVIEGLREMVDEHPAALGFDSFVHLGAIPAPWPEGAGLPERPSVPALSGAEAIADHVDQEALVARWAWALRSVVPPVTRIVEGEKTRIRVHPETRAALARLGRRERKARIRGWRKPYQIAFRVTGLAGGALYTADVTIGFRPLVLDCDRGEAYHPAEGRIDFVGGTANRGEWSQEDVQRLWHAIDEKLEGVV